MDFKLLGSILLIVGTSIGAGMLGLPIVAAELGFLGSAILLLLCWLIMTAGAFLILEVNLWLPQNSNLISMAKATLGPVGQILSWLTYLLLLYSLLCAYIAGGSDLFHQLLLKTHFDLSPTLSAILFTLIFGFVVFLGIHAVDYTNRLLMLIKFTGYFLLVIFLTPYISFDKLMDGDLQHLTSASAMTVTMTSFGYATILPSLRVYFAGDVKKLRKAIIIGSAIPLLCYLAWDAVIMGIIPLSGEQSLTTILHSDNSTSSLVTTLEAAVQKPSLIFFVKLFTSACVLTSFLGVALCLTDFFADGFQIEKKGFGNLVVHGLTFLPSLLIAIYFPNVFIKALEYAGIYAIILLILLPTCMAWCGRYRKHFGSNRKGQLFLGGMFILSCILLIQGCLG